MEPEEVYRVLEEKIEEAKSGTPTFLSGGGVPVEYNPDLKEPAKVVFAVGITDTGEEAILGKKVVIGKKVTPKHLAHELVHLRYGYRSGREDKPSTFKDYLEEEIPAELYAQYIEHGSSNFELDWLISLGNDCMTLYSARPGEIVKAMKDVFGKNKFSVSKGSWNHVEEVLGVGYTDPDLWKKGRYEY